MWVRLSSVSQDRIIHTTSACCISVHWLNLRIHESLHPSYSYMFPILYPSLLSTLFLDIWFSWHCCAAITCIIDINALYSITLALVADISYFWNNLADYLCTSSYKTWSVAKYSKGCIPGFRFRGAECCWFGILRGAQILLILFCHSVCCSCNLILNQYSLQLAFT